jgi:hypothetical protein
MREIPHTKRMLGDFDSLRVNRLQRNFLFRASLGVSPDFIHAPIPPIVRPRSMVVTLMSRLSIGLLIVILVGIALVVAWPVILIGAMVLALSKGADAWKRPPVRLSRV